MQWEYPKKNLEPHRWFAWHPVFVGDRIVWLEWVQRKGLLTRSADPHGGWSDHVFWKYEPLNG